MARDFIPHEGWEGPASVALQLDPDAATHPAPAADTPHIRVCDVAVDFVAGGERQHVLRGVNLTVPKGRFVSLIGPSGCGKSTLLKIIAGLIEPDAGDVAVAGLPPGQAARSRKIGLVFQDPTLLPWKSALDNAAFLLSVSDPSVSAAQARDRAAAMLRLVGLDDSERKRPSQLSGGMRQRVAIARALTLDPDVLLMDEPFAALDAITREEMRQCLLDIWEKTGKTILLVTHSIDEAVYVSGEVHVMGGRPAAIVETLPVGLPYPRIEAFNADPVFVAAKAHLRLLLIEHHHRRPA